MNKGNVHLGTLYLIPLHYRYRPIIPHTDEQDGGSVGVVLFTELVDGGGEEEDNVLSSLSKDMHRLNVEEGGALDRTGAQ